MMTNPNLAGYQTYQKNKYETASPHRLILMLYEGAIRFGNHAIQAIEEKEISMANQSIQKVQNILYELISSLNENQGGEIAINLKNLYLYMIDQLFEANIKKDVEPIKEVIELLESLRSAWEEIGKDVSIGQQG